MKYIKFIVKNKAYSVTAAVVVVGLLAYFFFIKDNGELPYEIYKISYDNVYQEISETGVVRPPQSIDLAFETQGKVASIKVKAGDSVEAGQELARLDRDELNLQVLKAQAVLETSQAKLDKVLAGASVEDIQVYETAVTNAEIALRNEKQALADTIADAESDLEQAYEDMVVDLYDAYVDCDDAVRNKVDQFFDNPRGSSPQLSFSPSDSLLEADIENERFLIENTLDSWRVLAEASADSIDLDMYADTGEQNLNQVKSFLDKVALAVNSLTSDAGLSQTTIDAWKAAVATARTNISADLTVVTDQRQTVSATKITNQTNINTAQAAVDTDEASLKTAQDNLALKKAAPREADLALAEAEVEQARASLRLKQKTLTQSVLRSPVDGVVTMVDVEVGEITQANTAVVFVDARDNFQIEADIYEEDIPWIKIGDPVEMEVVAFPDEILKGSVVLIDPAEKMVNGVVYYEVKIAFDEEKAGLRSGMTADVVIRTDSRENVLVVSKDAVIKRDGEILVEVVKDGIITERNIELGLEGSDNFYEVVSGLGENEEVVIR